MEGSDTDQSTIDRRQRLQGGLLGMLVGDALGVPYEFKSSERIPSYHQIEFEPPAGFLRSYPEVPPGTWSDDGAQALCLLESLLAHGELNLIDFSQRLQNWYFEGHMAVGKHVFDVGIQTREAIVKLSKNYFPEESGRRDEYANGNGSLMRVLPLALWHQGDDRQLVADAHEQSIVTHAHPRAMVCCALYCLWARRVLERCPTPWEAAVAALRELYRELPVHKEQLEEHVRPDSRPGGNGTGYVVDSLHSARLACEETSFEKVVKRAVQIGNDTDTTACVAGGIAGIQYGIQQIPRRFLEGLRGQELVAPLLDKLLSGS
ncbi:ADP-ribosylglycohydrolase family protein [Pelagicoccus sp. SDUM812003]|uniref:ADP-ribosylglycohydrolase family protein n=1 Tax=Pelagicoccus sp. SDUM812003 TaxID=3041267 RepID=UPI00280DAA29|nr:ADP-ribosylglycohydrolase family protein [Pelagicoccus sp. SDUM812003]MDQ8203957.1 ADP-ribosylglycohydrolase family protein [Pelagicoccus sp. SDUM812003]